MNDPIWTTDLLARPAHAALVALLGVLLLGSAGRFAAISIRRHQGRGEAAADRLASLGTWWVLYLVFSAAILLGPLGICVFLALASMLGLREFSRLILDEFEPHENESHDHGLAMFSLLVLVAATFGPIALGYGAVALAVAPMLAVVLIALSQVVEDAPTTYVRATGGLLLGSITLISGLGHGALLADSQRSNHPASGVSWFLLLVVLTELNDIGQALVGRRIGRHHITPRLSPNKTWEGLLGGWSVTCLSSILMTPFLTDLGDRSPQSSSFGEAIQTALPWSIAAATVISLSGFLGDLNMSGVKRFVGVKDSSRALPGMGGVLDRVDSLTLTAPCFYWLIAVPYRAGLLERL